MQNMNGVTRCIGCCLLLFLVAGALWLTCDQQSPINPTQSIQGDKPVLVGMSASPPKVVSGGGTGTLSRISVRLVDKDLNPLSNEVVTFTTTLGSLSATQDSTDSDGLAEVFFQSGSDEGNATITAQYGQSVSTSINIEIISQLDNPILLLASRNALYANGVDTTKITIILSDEYVEEATEDIVVQVTADLGSFTTNVFTFVNNVATTVFVSEPSAQDTVAEITATYKDYYSTTFIIHVGIQVEVNAYPQTILPDGVSQSTITTIIKESTRKVAIQNAMLVYGTDLGIIPNASTTNSQGVAQVQLTSAKDTGTAHVSVLYGGMDPIVVDVAFSDEAPTTHNLARLIANPLAILANGSDYSEISAYVVDAAFEPVLDVLVQFETDYGSIPAAAFTNSSGLATVSLYSDTSTTDITANVKAILNQHTDSTTVQFEGIRLTISATPDSILANGFSTATISALIKKTRSNVVVPNQMVRFESSSGTLIDGEAITNSEGIASVVLKSSTSPGVAEVVAFYGETITDTVNISFIESTPKFIKLTADPEVLLSDETSQSTLEARVTDANQIPVPGTKVTFELEGKTEDDYWGSLNPTNTFTNEDGFAYSTLTSGDMPDTVKVRAYFGEKGTESFTSDSVAIEYISGEVNTLKMKLEKYNTSLGQYEETESIKADGLEKCRITVTVEDAYGHLLPWIPVSFSATIGNITPTAQTDINGEAVAYFSSDMTGATVITATVQKLSGGSVSINDNLYLLPGLPNSIVLAFDPIEIGVKGTGQNQTATITAEVRDSKNNIVKDSTLVVFRIIEGPNGGESLSTLEPIPSVGGISRVSISSGTISGNVRVQAKIVEIVGGEIQDYTNEIGNIISESSLILIHAGPPYMEDRNRYYSTHLTIVAEALNIWRGLGSTTVTVSVFDKYHNPVQESEVYLTSSGGGITTHGTQTNEHGIVNATLYGANPQPYIHKFYYGELMQDPNNSSLILPGVIKYPELNNEELLPNFDAYPGGPNTVGSAFPWSPIENSMQDSIDLCTRYNHFDKSRYVGLENDGITRILAQVEGRDENGDSLRVWDWMWIVFSGPVRFQENSVTSFFDPDNVIYWGESRTLTFSLMDDNGNPIESNSTIKAKIPQEVDASLSWNEINTGWGVGTSFYRIIISNTMSLADEDPKPGTATIQIDWTGEHQFGFGVTDFSIFAADTSRPAAPGPPGF